MFSYPFIISWIFNFAYDLAWGSIGNEVYDYFNKDQIKIIDEIQFAVSTGATIGDSITTKEWTGGINPIGAYGRAFNEVSRNRRIENNANRNNINANNIITNETFFIIATGIFAIIEYLICILEFFIVATVGIILFPFSIWEGSKFMAESYIKTIIGFFMKLLFVTISIFLCVMDIFLCLIFLLIIIK